MRSLFKSDAVVEVPLSRMARDLVVASLCGLVCVVAGGVVPGVAAAEQIGSYGKGSGEFEGPFGVALDPVTGDVYVADQGNSRIDKFAGSGSFVSAWGWNVDDESSPGGLQVCTRFCVQGFEGGTGAGQLYGAQGVAVDGDLLSSSYGDVYVVNFENHRVEKFDSSGKFLLTFGGGVNKTSGGNVCLASEAEACQAGTLGASNGQFNWNYSATHDRSFIAVGPSGAVYVGDTARVQIFEPSGAWRENISLSGLSSTGSVTALAVSSLGDIFVNDSEATGVREFEAGGAEASVQFDAGSSSVEAIALDGSGDLFVADSTGGFHVAEYSPAGEELSSFGSGAVATTGGMVFSDALKKLYVGDLVPEMSSVQVLELPAAGPLVESGSESAKVGQAGAATLEAKFNPEGEETNYHFEYVNDAHFQVSGYEAASSSPSLVAGPGFADEPVNVALTKLAPGVYHYRLVATNSKGTATGQDQTVTNAGVEGPWAENVASTSVTLAARIDPMGTSAGYRLEYGTTIAYGHTLSGNVGEGSNYVSVSYHQQELQPAAVYHYRIVVTNAFGTFEGPDHTLTTQSAGGGLLLPDGRAWELVSPVNKHAGSIEPFGQGMIQAAADGTAISYLSTEVIGEDSAGKGNLYSQIFSSRGQGEWTSRAISPAHGVAPEGESSSKMTGGHQEYQLFSSDLSQAVVKPAGVMPPLSPDATEPTLYFWHNVTKAYTPLVTRANVPPGTSFGGTEANEGSNTLQFIAASPDANHVIIQSPFQLTPEAVTDCPSNPSNPPSNTCEGPQNLFEWGAGHLKLVDVLPDGKPVAPDRGDSPQLGAEGILVAHAISDDGRWVVWHAGAASRADRGIGTTRLYVRDMVADHTLRVGGSTAVFEWMSADGSRVFFVENGDLHVFDTAAGTQTDITPNHGASESSAETQVSGLSGSNDGSYMYFLAKGALASGAVIGEDNVYVAHDSGSGWTTTLVATLSSQDSPSWASPNIDGVPALKYVTSRVSPNGRYLAFMSERPLTGYDNVDALSGQADEEVFLYDAVSGRLACASCNPSGARPVGMLDRYTGVSGPVVDEFLAWRERWIAGSLPGRYGVSGFARQYQARYLSDGGRLFFDSPDALAGRDTNGLEDVYEYEPGGVGDCTSASVTFSERSQGCVGLISLGTSSAESAFLDASENGNDVFFVTNARLSAADYDTSPDVYDAHVCSGEVPCVPVPVLPPACTSGDSCKAAPSPQPVIFGPAPSATFSGTGNVEGSPTPAIGAKSLSRAQRLARALRACRKQKGARRRSECARRAKKRYGAAKQATKARATRKGNR